MTSNELPQTDSYYNARRQQNGSRLSGWLPNVAIVGSIIVLLAAIMMPLWLPGAIRRVVPDRYLIAYAPPGLQSILFNIDPNKTLPTPMPGGEPGDPLAAVGVDGATPWPTLEAITSEPGAAESSAAGSAAEATAAIAIPATQEPAFATATPEPVFIPGEALLTGMAHVPQGYNMCGPATMTTYLSFYGSGLGQNDVGREIKPHPEDSNVRPDELADFARSQGYGAVMRINGTLDTLKALIAAGYPVMIERGFDELPDEGWMGHYMLMIGYSDVTGEFIAMDSYWGTNRRHDDPSFPVDRWEYGRFDALWQDFNRTYIVVYPAQQQAEIARILGPEMDDATMLAGALNRTLAETQADPNDPFAWFNLGEIYNALGTYPEAAAAFDQARQLGTPWRTMWYRFGPYEAYFHVGRYDDVVALARATTDPSNYPESEEAFYWMGKVFEARGDSRNARAMYQKALQYNQHYLVAQSALNALGDG